MIDFFASLYEWFGLMPSYSTHMGEHLRGWDGISQGYVLAPWYIYIGWIMITLTAFIYALQYHIIDSSRWNKKQHWWFFAMIIILLNFLIAFTIPYNSLQAGDYSNDLNLTVSDCIGFGLSNAIWSFILFVIISTIPLFRRLSTNCRNTTFWKP